MGVCQNIVVGTVLADQTFTCVETFTAIPLGVALPPGSAVSSIAFTQIQAGCATVFDTVTNTVDIDFTFTVSAAVTISTIPAPISVSGIVLTCSGTFCGLAANMFSVTDQALIDCELVQVAGITHTDDSLDLVNGTLATTITVTSSFALVRRETITVSLCPGGNATAVFIPSTPCQADED